MPGVALIQQMFQQAVAHHSRSTVMSPLVVALSLLLASFLASFGLHAPAWASAWLLAMVLAVAGLYGWAYVYFATRKPDALRSERFTISKLKLERSALGDGHAGPGRAELPAGTSIVIGEVPR